MNADYTKHFLKLGNKKRRDASIPVAAMFKRPLVLIGRSLAGKPLFLFEAALTVSRPPNVKLENIEVRYSEEMLIELGQGKKKGTFSVIEYTGVDLMLQNSFIQIIGIHIESLRGMQAVSATKIAALVQGLVDLFKAQEAVQTRKSLQGLWAELFLISRAKDCKKAVSWWAKIPNHRVDFHSERQELEVKSSSSGFRVHTFSQEQIPGSIGPNFYVASVLLSPSESGTSLSDLVSVIQKKLSGTTARASFETKLYLRTGGDTNGWENISFDLKSADQALRLFRGDAIPRIRKADRGVIRVKTEVELAEQLALSGPVIRKLGDLISTLAT